MTRHIVWRRRKHDGRYYPALHHEFNQPHNAEAKARAAASGEIAYAIDETRHAHITALADLALLYPIRRKS